jgi:GNAT superfamily N-acetyltransferase
MAAVSSFPSVASMRSLRIRAVKDIRDARYVEILARLHSETLPNIPFPGVWPSHWWIVWDGKTPVAFAFMCGADRYENTGYFGRVGVIESHRGRGLQRRLMRVAEKKARALGWEAIVSDTRNRPHSAANFERLGYKPFTPEKPWDYKHAIYWRKDLN